MEKIPECWAIGSEDNDIQVIEFQHDILSLPLIPRGLYLNPGVA